VYPATRRFMESQACGDDFGVVENQKRAGRHVFAQIAEDVKKHLVSGRVVDEKPGVIAPGSGG